MVGTHTHIYMCADEFHSALGKQTSLTKVKRITLSVNARKTKIFKKDIHEPLSLGSEVRSYFNGQLLVNGLPSPTIYGVRCNSCKVD